ncbi:MAG: ABC transporter ATP-binding protein [Chitinivibrionales bacterium]
MSKKKKTVNTYLRMTGYMEPYILLFAAAAVLTIVIVVLDGVALWFSGNLIQTLFSDSVSAEVERPEFKFSEIKGIFKYYSWRLLTLNNSGSHSEILKSVCILIPLLYLIKNLLKYLNSLLIQFLNLKIVRDIRNQYYQKLMSLPISFYNNHTSGHLVSLAVRDIGAVNRSLTQTIMKLFMEPTRIIVYIALLLIISWQLTLIVFIIYPVLLAFFIYASKVIRRRSKRSLQSFSGLVDILNETIRGIKVVKLFDMAESEKEKYFKENQKFTKKSFRAVLIKEAMSPVTESIAMAISAFLLWYGGSQVLSGTSQITGDDFVRFLMILFSSYQPLKRITKINNYIQNGIAAAQRVFAVMDTGSEPKPSKEPPAPASFNNKIEFNNVTFSYPGCSEKVLKDLSFKAGKGEVIAIVGPSGAGKSTVLDLLPGFYQPDSGSIKIDNTDIRDMYIRELRQLFASVSQDVILFNDSVRNNIAYGQSTDKVSEAEIFRAVDSANARGFIEELPDGIYTHVGENGVMLSGGQKQRISIARAILKNPQILILDEATSALDTESEMLVQKALTRLMKNRTSIVVAHRLSTIKHADRIIVLEQGRIVEEGSHSELLKLNKRYKYFYDIQFS